MDSHKTECTIKIECVRKEDLAWSSKLSQPGKRIQKAQREDRGGQRDGQRMRGMYNNKSPEWENFLREW